MNTAATKIRRKPRPAGQRAKWMTSTVLGAFEDGKGEMNDLREGIGSWKDNLESNSMEHMPKYEEVSECFNYLETMDDSLQSLEVPECLQDLEVKYTIDTRLSSQSRSTTFANADSALSAALDAANHWLEENPELTFVPEDERDPDEDEAAEGFTYYEEDAEKREQERSEVEEFIAELEPALEEGRNASFPGMY